MVVAEDEVEVRRALVAVLETWSGVEVVGVAADGLEAVRLHDTLSPDIVILDVAMPRCDGLQATRRILAAAPETCVIVLSSADDARLVGLCVQAGARGVLRKDRQSLTTAGLVLRLLAIRAPR